MKNFKLNKKQKRKLRRIIIAFSFFVVLFTISKVFKPENAFNEPISWLLPCFVWLALYIFVAKDILSAGIYNLLHGQLLDEKFLMLIASLGAFSLGIVNGVNGNSAEGFDEAVAVALFYEVGQFFEQVATEKSRKSISDLINMRPDFVNLITDNGVEQIMPEEVKVGSDIVIYPGEKIPVDCKVISGASSVDCKALTGESLPIEVEKNDLLLSGSVNLTSQLTCKVEKEFYDSTVCKILELVENSSDKKSKAENFIAKFAKYYTPIVIFLAILTAIVPSLITKDYQTWIYRALSFLVVSCPCALVISVPMTFFVALGKASKRHILVKGSNYLELLAKANLFTFDKTGTITKGQFEIEGVYPSENRNEILKLAAIAEKNSSHPIAKCICSAVNEEIPNDYTLTDYSGFGVMAKKNDEVIICGNARLLEKFNIEVDDSLKTNTTVFVAKNNSLFGYITLTDSIKSEVNGVIDGLLKEHCKVVMLTGDNYETAKKVADKCGIPNFKAELLPQDKVKEVEQALQNKGKNEVLCFVGDGINDAPVLMRSDIGIAMGGIGSDAAIEASDIVLMRDNLSDLLTAKLIAKKALRIVKQNIVFSLFVKIAILILSFFGITNMWFSIFGDVGVAVIAILNALRVEK